MKKIIIALICILAFSACTDDFLNTQNRNSLDVGSFFKTEKDLQLAVNAAYCPLEFNGMYGVTYFLIFNTLDPYIWFENPKSGYDQLIINPNDFSSTYQALYIGLYRTSSVLANIDRLKDVLTAEKYASYKAQITALRAMYYFDLVTWFNAPIYYDETSLPANPLIGYKNGTPEQFWNKLEEDLNYAAANLPTVWPSSETGRITKGAANALLGKALLFKYYHYYKRFGKENTAESAANLAKAKAAFENVINSKNYKLSTPLNQDKANFMGALLANFTYLDIPVGSTTYKAENNSESVWEVQYNDDDRANIPWLPGWLSGGQLLNAYFSPLGYRNHEIDPSLWNEFETTGTPAGFSRDPRAYATCYLDGDTIDWRPSSGQNVPFNSAVHSKQIVLSNGLYSGAVTYPSKSLGLKKYYYPQWTSKDPLCSPTNVRVIRYADVLLMYAEIKYLIDADLDGAGLQALNDVRARAGMAPIATLTPAAIVHERAVELATEGHHYNDIVRWTFDSRFPNDVNAMFKGNFKLPKNQYFPIPQSEIDANKGALIQNPGW